MSEQITAAVIGLGVGERHISGYVSDSRCNLVAICDLDEEKLTMSVVNIQMFANALMLMKFYKTPVLMLFLLHLTITFMQSKSWQL